MTLFLGWFLWNYGLTPKQILEVWVSENISCRGLPFIFSSAIITQIHEKWLFSAIITQIHEKWLFWTLIILFDNSPPRNLVIRQKHACMDATPTMCSLESLEDLFQCSWKRGSFLPVFPIKHLWNQFEHVKGNHRTRFLLWCHLHRINLTWKLAEG